MSKNLASMFKATHVSLNASRIENVPFPQKFSSSNSKCPKYVTDQCIYCSDKLRKLQLTFLEVMKNEQIQISASQKLKVRGTFYCMWCYIFSYVWMIHIYWFHSRTNLANWSGVKGQEHICTILLRHQMFTRSPRKIAAEICNSVQPQR